MRGGAACACGDPFWDLAVVGSGAAGLAAAVGAAAAGLSVVVLGRSEPGGGVLRWARLETVPGLPVGLSGEEWVARTVARAEAYGVRIAGPSAVLALEPRERAWALRRADGNVVRARAVVAATGAARELPAVPGLEAFLGAGVYPALTPPLAARLPGRDVFVEVGTAPTWARGQTARGAEDTAARLVLELADVARSVTLLGPAARLGRGTAGARAGALRSRANVVLRPGLRLAGLLGVDHLETVVLRGARGGTRSVHEAAAVFLPVAARPRTGWLGGACASGAGGGLLTGGGTWAAHRPGRVLFPNETSLPGVFAVGAVRERPVEGWGAVADGWDAVGQVGAWLAAASAA